MCISKNVDNVDNFVEKYYLQPGKWIQKSRKACKTGRNS